MDKPNLALDGPFGSSNQEASGQKPWKGVARDAKAKEIKMHQEVIQSDYHESSGEIT